MNGIVAARAARRAVLARRRVGIATGVGLGVVLATSVASMGVSSAQSLPLCGGQHAPPHPVPYTCTTPTQTIDGSQVFAVLHANGQTVTVTYTLLAPRPTDAPIRINHHLGISGGGGPTSTAEGVIPAGQTTATLSVTTPCVAGQVDIKFVFILDTQPQGRVGGPWIENGTGCTSPTTTTTPSTTAPTTTAPTTTSASATTVAATTTVPPSSVSQAQVSSTLPVTGRSERVYGMALVALAVGSLMVIVAGARRVRERLD